MYRRRLYRIVALPLVVWFVALATDVGGVDACPMHDAMARAASGATAAMHMAQMPGMIGNSGAPTAPDVPQQGPMHCTCMGLCCGCAIATLPSTPVTTVLVPMAVRRPVRIAGAPMGFAAARLHVLPPSIGPPSLHA
ncbi:MAG: hypothetical protein ACRENQ_03710 [Gemmatimonadaceae bacterium]